MTTFEFAVLVGTIVAIAIAVGKDGPWRLP